MHQLKDPIPLLSKLFHQLYLFKPLELLILCNVATTLTQQNLKEKKEVV